MNFDFSDDAKALGEQARRFLTERAGPAAARRQMDGDAPWDAALWSSIVELGWTAARVPEAHGGLGLSAEEACVLAEEAGRSLVPVPLISTLLATEALLACGSEAQQARWLPGVADGSVVATVGRGVIADAVGADLAIVADGEAFRLVDLSAATPEPVATMDLVRRHARVAAEGEAMGDEASYQRWLDRAAVLTAWEAIGTASAAMAMAVGYAKERVAFGQPIGRYQAIKHKCADMYVKLELARAHAMRAAWAMATDAAELPQAAAAARVAALDALRFAAEENVQIHGGIGFTWESDCQFYYRRHRQIAFALGPRAMWAERLVRALERRNRIAA